MSKKGFTLVELLVTISILGLIMIMIIPAVSRLQDDYQDSEFEAYGETLVRAAQLYVDREGEDISSYGVDNWTGCVDITYDDLQNIISPFDDEAYDCSNAVVRYSKTQKDTSYSYNMTCIEVDSNKTVFTHTDFEESEACTQTLYYANANGNIKGIAEEVAQQVNPKSIINYHSGDITNMYTFSHQTTDQQSDWTTDELTDYRYIGSSPNNFVSFNNELWRIVGIFTVENEAGSKEKRFKIVRDQSIGNNTYGTNNWTASSLNTYLNDTYYNTLNDTAKSMIASTKWYLGGAVNNAINGSVFYNFERGSLTFGNAPTNWIGKVGLLYSSDYAYTFMSGVDTSCYNNLSVCNTSNPSASWLYDSSLDQQLLTPLSVLSTQTLVIGKNGSINLYNANATSAIRPVVYLDSNVGIVSGSGTRDNPYQLSNEIEGTYQLSTTNVTGGNVTLTSDSVEGGSTVTFTADPNSGFSYYGATIKSTTGTVLATLDSNTNSFTMPYRDVIVSPKWKYNDKSIMVLDDMQDTTWTSNLTDGYILNYGYDSTRHYLTFHIDSSGNARRAAWTDKSYDLTNYATYQVRVYEFGNNADLQHATFYAGVSTNMNSWPHAGTASFQTDGTGYMRYVTLNVDITNLSGNYYLGVEMLTNNHATGANFTHAYLIGKVYE